MNYPALKISVKIGIATALAIILFQVCNIFLVYKYFKFDYYITAVAGVFLVAGSFISRVQHRPAFVDPGPAADPLPDLTGKELSILRLIADGKTNKEIAAINYVEVSTIKTHINNIYTKMGLTNRRQAVDHFKSLEKLKML